MTSRFKYDICFGATRAELELEAMYWGRRVRQALDRGFTCAAYRCALRAGHAVTLLRECAHA